MRWLLRLLVLAGLGFLAWKVWQLMDEDEDHSAEWADAARAKVQGATAPAAAEGPRAEPPAEARARAAGVTAAGAKAGGTTPEDDAGPDDAGADAAWVKPNGSSCPPGYPVKAKTGSKVYRVPGMFSYEESKPERCYRDEAAAMADGFTRAKR